MLAFVVAVGAVTWIAVAGTDDSATTPDRRLGQVSVKGIATVGEPAPDFTLRTLEGDTVTLADYRGKPVIVNFWASYCIPCRDEFPMFRRQLAKHDGKFVVLGVDYKDIASDARAFAKHQRATWPILEDPDNVVGAAYGIRAVPQTFFVRRDGTIAQRVYGQVSERFFERELAKILKAARTAGAAGAG